MSKDSPANSQVVRILLLEDDANDATLIEATLADAGLAFVSQRVETAAAFARALDEYRPDIILSDFRLPGFDGRMALTMVQQHCPATPLLMVTGAMGDEMAVELLKAGARDYVLKDRLARLPSAVRRALAEAEETRQRQAAEKALRESEEKFRSLAENAPDAIGRFDRQGRFLYLSPAVERMLGFPPGTAIGRRFGELTQEAGYSGNDASIESARQAIRQVVTTGLASEIEETWMFPDGERIFEGRLLPEYDEHRQVASVLAIFRDITARRRAEQELRIAAIAFESDEALIITDAQAVILRVNRAFTEMTGYTADEVRGKTPRVLKSGRHDAAFYETMWQQIKGTGSWQGEIWNRRKNGSPYPGWLTITAVYNTRGKVTHYVGALMDITSRVAAEAEIRHLAFYDALTQLPNRRLLFDRLQQSLGAKLRYRGVGAVLFIDLDNFKTLNDTCGHDVGDQLLQRVAERLIACIREGDTVARLGGDEFVVMLHALSEIPREAAGQADIIGEKIRSALNQPYQFGGHEYRSTASIGATLFGVERENVDDVLKRADLALYQAKGAGRNTVRTFDLEIETPTSDYGRREAGQSASSDLP